MSTQYRVDADGLNLRSEPRVHPSTRVAVLARGDVVRRLGGADDAAWWRVRVQIGNREVTGYVAHRYLKPVASVAAPQPTTGISVVHLAEGRTTVTRDSIGGAWAYPLGEGDRPTRSGTSPEGRASELRDIVDWLRVDVSRRYQPKGGFTYCNIYAHDYCYLAGAYLPRVWWTGRALADLATGAAVVPRYGATVTEVNANQLMDWLIGFGPQFGWQRVFDTTELQDAANAGEVCVICAQRRDASRSGHIVGVVPEGAQRALRNGDTVRIPLQSQAGVTNFRYDAPPRPWWAHERYRDFGFWRHA